MTKLGIIVKHKAQLYTKGLWPTKRKWLTRETNRKHNYGQQGKNRKHMVNKGTNRKHMVNKGDKQEV